MNYPEYVDEDEKPEFSAENIPADVLERAISIAVQYRACPECGHRQFMSAVPGNTVTHQCTDCGVEMAVV